MNCGDMSAGMSCFNIYGMYVNTGFVVIYVDLLKLALIYLVWEERGYGF